MGWAACTPGWALCTLLRERGPQLHFGVRVLQAAYEKLDSREQRIRQVEAELAEARQQAEADRKAADLAKRNLDAERSELQQVKEELRIQQAQQAAEARRLDDLQQVGSAQQLCSWTSTCAGVSLMHIGLEQPIRQSRLPCCF